MPSVEKFFSKHIQPHKSQFYFILFLLLLLVIVDLVTPWTFKLLIDNVFENQPVNPESIEGMVIALFSSKVQLGFFVVFVFFFCKLVFSILDYFRTIYTKKFISTIITEYSKKAFSNVEMFSIGFYRTQEIGDYVYRLSYDVLALGEFMEQGLFLLIRSVLYMAFISLIFLFIDVQLALLSLIAFPFLMIGLYILNKKVVTASKKSEYWNSSVFSFLQQSLMQLRVIQAYSQEKKELKAFNRKMEKSLQSSFVIHKLSFVISLFVSVCIAVLFAVIIGTGVVSVFEGTLTPGLLVVLILYLNLITYPLLSFIYAISIMRESHTKLARLEAFFDQKSHIQDTGTIGKVEKTNIEFKEVTLKTDSGKMILDHLSFSIPQGKITAIIGTSGSGKTSTISLIPRLINEPTSGKILLGNSPLEEYKIKALREAIAYVPQEILLPNTTIHNIISYGKERATIDEIQEAARLASADEFIHTLPDEYDFKVGEGGNYLSVGQRQRLMLARAYIKKAPLIILDEVFSSQDPKTRLQMVENFRRSIHQKTIILVSNIFEVVAEADSLIVIHNGKFIRAYSHEELLKKNLLRPENIDILLLGESK